MKLTMKLIKKMKITFGLLRIFLLSIVLNSCATPDHFNVSSPDGNFRFELRMENSQPFYLAYFKNKEIIGKSSIGFK